MPGRILRKNRAEKVENSPENGKKNSNSSDGEENSDDGENFEVEEILAKRTRNGRVEYFLKWKNYSVDEASWEPSKNINDKKLIDDYEKYKKLKSSSSPRGRGRKSSTPMEKTAESDDENEEKHSAETTKNGGENWKKRKRIQMDDDDDDKNMSASAIRSSPRKNAENSPKKTPAKANDADDNESTGFDVAENAENSSKRSKKAEIDEDYDDKSEKSEEIDEKPKKRGRKLATKPKKGVGKRSASADYVVERIIDVRQGDDGKKEYLLKWKNYSSAQNTWEPVKNLTCKKLIAQFEAGRRPISFEEYADFVDGSDWPDQLTGAIRKKGEIWFASILEGQKVVKWIRMETARKICPQLVIDFMMDRVEWPEEAEKAEETAGI